MEDIELEFTTHSTVTSLDDDLISINRKKIQKLSALQIRRKLIESIAEEVHPGNWDLGEIEPRLSKDMENNDISRSQYRLLIRFPEATIQNSEGVSKDIKDFYVAIFISSDFKRLTSRKMLSMRTSVTTKEFSVGITHPHSYCIGPNSNVKSYFTWRNMCLGGETALTDLMFSLNTDKIEKKTFFELMILLHVYVGWESLEGGPYLRMSNWNYPTRSSENYNSYINSGIIYPELIKLLTSTDTHLQRPEIIGSDTFSITNIYISIAPLIKIAILKHLTAFPELCLNALGVTSNNGNFQPLSAGNQRQTVKPLEFYLTMIEETKKLNSEEGKKIINFKEESYFEMTLDPQGLSEDYNIDEQLIEQSEVHPTLLRECTEVYLLELRNYKISCIL